MEDSSWQPAVRRRTQPKTSPERNRSPLAGWLQRRERAARAVSGSASATRPVRAWPAADARGTRCASGRSPRAVSGSATRPTAAQPAVDDRDPRRASGRPAPRGSNAQPAPLRAASASQAPDPLPTPPADLGPVARGGEHRPRPRRSAGACRGVQATPHWLWWHTRPSPSDASSRDSAAAERRPPVSPPEQQPRGGRHRLGGDLCSRLFVPRQGATGCPPRPPALAMLPTPRHATAPRRNGGPR